MAAGYRHRVPWRQLVHPHGPRTVNVGLGAKLAPTAPSKRPDRTVFGDRRRVEEAAGHAHHFRPRREGHWPWQSTVQDLRAAEFAELVATEGEELTARGQRGAMTIPESDPRGRGWQCEWILHGLALARPCVQHRSRSVTSGLARRRQPPLLSPVPDGFGLLASLACSRRSRASKFWRRDGTTHETLCQTPFPAST